MAEPGKVYLVGAGPGSPGLITVRGRDLLRRADVVLYDGLVHPLLLRDAKPSAGCVLASSRTMGQTAISERLVAEARAGKSVVRLKGGDPYIFGRGGEEADALARAGIPFEVVPGVTAAVAAGDYAGICFTHRELSSAVAFVTGHEDLEKNSPYVDYAALAAFPGTLVFYMGLHRADAIAESLIDHGMPRNTPAAVVSRATTAGQRSIVATLDTLGEAVRAAGLKPPSIIVVGEAIGQNEEIGWYERLPLFGVRVGVTRPIAQAGPIVERLLELGAEPVLMPTIEIRPPASWELIDAAIDRLTEFDWLIFTSANGVDSFLSRVWDRGGDARRLGAVKIATIGPATGDALERFGLRPDLVPPEYRAESLADELLRHVAGQRVLWARANRGRELLAERVKPAAASFETVVVYENHDVAAYSDAVARQLAAGEVHWVALGSPSIAEGFHWLCPAAARAKLGTTIRLASISPVTSEQARANGLPIAAEAVSHTWEGLIDAILLAKNAE